METPHDPREAPLDEEAPASGVLEEDEFAALWMLRARCRGSDPAQFFPSDGVGVDAARRLCAECDVRIECLEYALEHRIDHGVWGGCSERERRRILRRRRAAGVTLPETR